MKPVRLRKHGVKGVCGAFWAEAVVDRQQRGLAVTQDKWASDASRWSVTHIASGRCLTQNLRKKDARWLMAQCLKRRVAWTRPYRALLKVLSKGERATLGLLIVTACAASGVKHARGI